MCYIFNCSASISDATVRLTVCVLKILLPVIMWITLWLCSLNGLQMQGKCGFLNVLHLYPRIKYEGTWNWPQLFVNVFAFKCLDYFGEFRTGDVNESTGQVHGQQNIVTCNAARLLGLSLLLLILHLSLFSIITTEWTYILTWFISHPLLCPHGLRHENQV